MDEVDANGVAWSPEDEAEGSGLEGLKIGAEADIFDCLAKGDDEGLDARRLGASDDVTDMVFVGTTLWL